MDAINPEPFSHSTSPSINSENIKLFVIIALSLFFYSIIFVSQLNNHFIPNKIMFMNMITDNYAQSITDFDKYVNKIIDDNDKIQSLLEFYRICETRDCD
jgi:ABC-type iron transport system FetAB permease component